MNSLKNLAIITIMHKKFLRTSVLIATLATCLGAGHTPGYTMNPEFMDKEELRTYLKNHKHTTDSYKVVNRTDPEIIHTVEPVNSLQTFRYNNT